MVCTSSYTPCAIRLISSNAHAHGVHKLRHAMCIEQAPSDKHKRTAAHGVHKLRHAVRIEQAPSDKHNRAAARGVHKLHHPAHVGNPTLLPL
ncbi:hypothetical protein HanIR_Chr06g0298361 [Helianthus annuus]|nr:hypothetical protein HanIR_Chr06g0298361 [Helianthus annuus]